MVSHVSWLRVLLGADYAQNAAFGGVRGKLGQGSKMVMPELRGVALGSPSPRPPPAAPPRRGWYAASLAASFLQRGKITILDEMASRQYDANEAENPLTWDFGAAAASQAAARCRRGFAQRVFGPGKRRPVLRRPSESL